jgi:hypothetical protein
MTSRQQLMTMLGEEKSSRVHFLMDFRTNRQRYERQTIEAQAAGSRR